MSLSTISLGISGIALLGALALLQPSAPPPADLQPIDPNGEINAVKERERWAKRIEDAGAAQAYQDFVRLYSPLHFGKQHYGAHIMGALLYEKGGLSALTICDNNFSFGCYHAFFSQALAAEGVSVIAELDRQCVEKYGEFGTGCQHGIGHGLLEYMGHDRLAEALQSCKYTTQKNPLFGCTSGIFMEYNVPIIIDEERTYTKFRELDFARPYEPCPTLAEEFQGSCYYEMGQWWDKYYPDDYRDIGKLCENIPNPKHKESCYLGVGNVAAPSSEYDPAEALRKCLGMPTEEGRLLCRSGASWSTFANPAFRDRAPQMCADLPIVEQKTCVQKSDIVGTGEINRNQ